MKKYIVHSKAIQGVKSGDIPAILEVEGEYVEALDDPSTMWLPSGEFKFRITKPEFLYEPQDIRQADGSKKKVMTPAVWHSHAIYASDDGAQFAAEKIVREQFEYDLRKNAVVFTEEQVEEKRKQIKLIKL